MKQAIENDFWNDGAIWYRRILPQEIMKQNVREFEEITKKGLAKRLDQFRNLCMLLGILLALSTALFTSKLTNEWALWSLYSWLAMFSCGILIGVFHGYIEEALYTKIVLRSLREFQQQTLFLADYSPPVDISKFNCCIQKTSFFSLMWLLIITGIGAIILQLFAIRFAEVCILIFEALFLILSRECSLSRDQFLKKLLNNNLHLTSQNNYTIIALPDWLGRIMMSARNEIAYYGFVRTVGKTGIPLAIPGIAFIIFQFFIVSITYYLFMEIRGMLA